MFEVFAGFVVGLLIVMAVFVITYAVVLPFEFEVEKIFLEEIQIELEVEMLAIIIFFEESLNEK